MIKKVLYFCSGNTCRSPFAEYFSKWLKNTKYKEELEDVEFDSAGIYRYYETPQDGTLKYLSTKGIEVTDFQAKRIDEALLIEQDLILGFEYKRHITKLKRKFKDLEGLSDKLFLLLEYAGESENLDIEDPFHMNQEDYNKILKRIEDGILKVFDKIRRINNS